MRYVRNEGKKMREFTGRMGCEMKKEWRKRERELAGAVGMGGLGRRWIRKLDLKKKISSQDPPCQQLPVVPPFP